MCVYVGHLCQQCLSAEHGPWDMLVLKPRCVALIIQLAFIECMLPVKFNQCVEVHGGGGWEDTTFVKKDHRCLCKEKDRCELYRCTKRVSPCRRGLYGTTVSTECALAD